jgi:hypothetical protein
VTWGRRRRSGRGCGGRGGVDDRLAGRGGNDTLKGGFGTDVLEGGDGVDTATDEDHQQAAATVTLDGVANDGQPAGFNRQTLQPFDAENDNVLTENVTGGGGDDTVVGDDGPNALSGGGGEDAIRGAGDNNAIDGGEGLDALFGEAGSDLLLANDGLADQIDCGPDIDLAFADLADAGRVLRTGGNPLPDSAGCENQSLAPAGRLPNVALADELVRIDRRGRAHVALRCPRGSARRCDGTVRLQRLDGTDLGVGRFAVRKGGRATVTVRLRRAVRRGPARAARPASSRASATWTDARRSRSRGYGCCHERSQVQGDPALRRPPALRRRDERQTIGDAVSRRCPR